jgi:Xaa-Pro aminopeptidase
MTELDLSVVAETASRRHGYQGILRWRAATGFECPWVHILAGPSALEFSSADTPYGGPGVTPAVPYGAGHRVIEARMPLCFDQAFALDGYIHDMTRTFSVGPVAEDLASGHDLCVAVHRELEAAALPGVSGEEVWDICRSRVSEAGMADQFMGLGPNRAGFVGHGVGLELDELPVLAPRQKARLEEGQVVALEPKLFYPGVGSVGLENTYLVRAGGLERITTTADELFVV